MADTHNNFTFLYFEDRFITRCLCTPEGDKAEMQRGKDG